MTQWDDTMLGENRTLHTISSLSDDLAKTGLFAGQTVLVHSSLRKVGGWICGGAEAVIQAFLDVLGSEGTLVMPTHTVNNTEPSRWQNPPVPEEWWDRIRAETPAYNPATARTTYMGVLPETIRTFPDARRSNHPIGSFTAIGKNAEALTADHPLEPMFGDPSPIGRLYDLDGYVMLFGVPYENCTALHLAEYRADFPKTYHQEGCAMLVNGERQWVPFAMYALDSDDFNKIGKAYEQAYPDNIIHSRVGRAETRLFRQRPLVDFAVDWMNKNRQS